MLYTLKNDTTEVFIKKLEDKYLVKIKTGEFNIQKEFSSRLELISTLEGSFSQNAFYKIP